MSYSDASFSRGLGFAVTYRDVTPSCCGCLFVRQKLHGSRGRRLTAARRGYTATRVPSLGWDQQEASVHFRLVSPCPPFAFSFTRFSMVHAYPFETFR